MRIYIDTNLLYRYSKIYNHTKYDINKIGKELDKYSEVIIFEFSILELYTHKDFERKHIKKVLKFITKKKNIKFLPIAAAGFDPIDLKQLIENSRCIKNLKDYNKDCSALLTKKIVHEARTLSFFIQSIFVMYMMMINDADPNPLNQSNLALFTIQSLTQILSYKETLSFELIGIINSKYYDSQNDGWFKNKLENMLLPCLMEISKIYFCIKNNYSYYTLNKVQEQAINQQMINNVLTTKLNGRSNGNNTEIFDQTMLQYFNNSYTKYENEMKISIPIGVVKYFGILMKRVFFTGRKLLKNDMIDSQFLFVYDAEQLLSIDDKFVNIITDFDANYGTRMEVFNNLVIKT